MADAAIRTGYDPGDTTNVADNAVTYVVQAAGNTWVNHPYRELGSIASYEHAKWNPKGVESVNANKSLTSVSICVSIRTYPLSSVG